MTYFEIETFKSIGNLKILLTLYEAIYCDNDFNKKKHHHLALSYKSIEFMQLYIYIDIVSVIFIALTIGNIYLLYLIIKTAERLLY